MDRVRWKVLEMCGIDFDLLLMNTLSKNTIMGDDLNLDSDGNSCDGMKKMSSS